MKTSVAVAVVVSDSEDERSTTRPTATVQSSTPPRKTETVMKDVTNRVVNSMLTTPPTKRKLDRYLGSSSTTPEATTPPNAPKKARGVFPTISPTSEGENLQEMSTPEEAFDQKINIRVNNSKCGSTMSSALTSSSWSFSAEVDVSTAAPKTPPMTEGSWKWVSGVGWLLCRGADWQPDSDVRTTETSVKVSVESETVGVSQPQTPPMLPGIWKYMPELGWVLIRL